MSNKPERIQMFKNPLTSIIGLLIVLCPIVEAFWPEVAGTCKEASNNLIGAGFIASADGVKNLFAKKTA